MTKVEGQQRFPEIAEIWPIFSIFVKRIYITVSVFRRVLYHL